MTTDAAIERACERLVLDFVRTEEGWRIASRRARFVMHGWWDSGH